MNTKIISEHLQIVDKDKNSIRAFPYRTLRSRCRYGPYGFAHHRVYAIARKINIFREENFREHLRNKDFLLSEVRRDAHFGTKY